MLAASNIMLHKITSNRTEVMHSRQRKEQRISKTSTSPPTTRLFNGALESAGILCRTLSHSMCPRVKKHSHVEVYCQQWTVCLIHSVFGFSHNWRQTDPQRAFDPRHRMGRMSPWGQIWRLERMAGITIYTEGGTYPTHICIFLDFQSTKYRTVCFFLGLCESNISSGLPEGCKWTWSQWSQICLW